MVALVGFEPTTSALSARYSATELQGYIGWDTLLKSGLNSLKTCRISLLSIPIIL